MAASRRKTTPKAPSASAGLFAVIDIGSSAVRLTIAEVFADNTLRIVESLQQSVSIGRDTFVKGFIEKSTIEECVGALRHFDRVLREHGITDPRRIRVAATTAVREAGNREAFCDRIHIASGYHVEVLDLTDTTRLTYVGVRPFLSKKRFESGNLLIVEMGGGTTDVCFISRGRTAFARTFRIGSLRLRQMMENARLSSDQQRRLLQQEIKRVVEQIAGLPEGKRQCTIVALGSEIRFAAGELVPDWEGIVSVAVSRTALTKLIDSIAAMPFDKMVRKYHLPYAEAETIVPALRFYEQLCRNFGVPAIMVASTSMRHGMLMEMAGFADQRTEFGDIILGSALDLARKYRADMGHAAVVESLAGTLFSALEAEHRLKPRHGLLLAVAAILHDIGFFIGPRSHHKHSLYLIQNSELFGLNSQEVKLVSLIARYHRRSVPKQSHVDYMGLDFENRLVVAKLSALLRIADALDHAHAGRIEKIDCAIEGDLFVMTAPGMHDVSLEQLSVQTKGQLFEDVYGLKPVIRPGG